MRTGQPAPRLFPRGPEPRKEHRLDAWSKYNRISRILSWDEVSEFGRTNVRLT